MDRPIIKEGKNVVLTLLKDEDAEWLWKNVNDRRVMRWIGSYGIYSIEEEKEFVKRAYNKDKPRFLIMDKKGNRVGVCGVNEFDTINMNMEVGIWIAPEFHGRGYGTEAAKLLVDLLFEEYPINKLYAELNANNVASRRVLEKLGFKREARLRKHIWDRNGRGFVDKYIYGLLRKEWERTRHESN